jgi:hypothetical protein
MTDAELIERLRTGATWDDDVAAADRIEALTAERDEYKRLALITDTVTRECKIHEARAEKAEAGRDRLREALEFYANEENYKWYSAVDPCGCCSSWYEPKIHINGDDSGQIARAALKGETP